jgi:hypothetical protein
MGCVYSFLETFWTGYEVVSQTTRRLTANRRQSLVMVILYCIQIAGSESVEGEFMAIYGNHATACSGFVCWTVLYILKASV